ncbi:hypothetical protein N0Y54_23230 [Nostoc punctiforme UO1]|uniref:hypothetical protein n=1 Tax=Nostoc punctiforme TaxID=272131 RepID=UPI0030B39139
MQADALAIQADALTIQADALTMQANALTINTVRLKGKGEREKVLNTSFPL